MAIHIDTPVQFLKGVGPKLGDVLRKRGIETVGDLLEWYPRTYEDRRAVRNISTLQPEQLVGFEAQILSVRSMNLGRSRRKMYEIIVGDKTGRIACKFFRVPYKGYFERFEPFQKVRVAGKVTSYRGRTEIHHPDIHHVKEGEGDKSDELIPLYTETEGLSPAKLRKIISSAFDALLEEPQKPKEKDNYAKFKAQFPEPRRLEDHFPSWLTDKYKLVEWKQALQEVHQPPPHTGDLFLRFQAPAQRRIIFEEFFWLELHLASRRAGLEKESAPAMAAPGHWVESFKKSLEFELTGAQVRSLNQVVEDLKKPHPMHRLVQGDVGSGKTMVALMAAAYAAESGFQSAIMVPTEILAEQHYKNAQERLAPLGLRVALLTGQIKGRERALITEALKAGEIHLCIGTHALIQGDVGFDKLGLVVIDEQHRFGVQQRNQLKAKGLAPHFLVMTATPIPRTLAMTVYGDLDVSIIDELPKGRQPIVTRRTFESKRDKVMQFLGDQIKAGRQGYVVYPLVEESEKIDLKNAVQEFESIQKTFPQFKVGLLHGKMKPQEKDEIMRRFRDNEIQILVATTVIEVGVDVPNANIMVIENAERFGLSQLHQLRGRVGRGAYKSYCVLMLGNAVSDESRARAEIMERTNDGFKIAEADLELRGPGEFMGTRQSGLPGFKMANLVRDVMILQDARQAAFELIRKDPELRSQEHKSIREQMERSEGSIVG